jgi:hypothetical protein
MGLEIVFSFGIGFGNNWVGLHTSSKFLVWNMVPTFYVLTLMGSAPFVHTLKHI